MRSIKTSESSLRLRELAIKERELSLKEQEHLRSRWNNPLAVAIAAATVAALANVYATHQSGVALENLERQKWLQTTSETCAARQASAVAELARMLSQRLDADNYALSVAVVYAAGNKFPKPFTWSRDSYNKTANTQRAAISAQFTSIGLQDPLLYRSMFMFYTILDSRHADARKYVNGMSNSGSLPGSKTFKDEVIRVAVDNADARQSFDFDLSEAIGAPIALPSSSSSAPIAASSAASASSRVTPTGCPKRGGSA